MWAELSYPNLAVLMFIVTSLIYLWFNLLILLKVRVKVS